MPNNLVRGAGFERTRQRATIPTPSVTSASVTSACDECSLLAEADHRIANHLALLSSHVRLKAADLALQPAELRLDNVRLLLAGIDAQITAVARLHRSLAANGRRASADLSEHLHATCMPFMSGLSGAITLIEDFSPGCVVRPDQVLPLTQIVAEVVTNAIKHAHAGGEAGVILVRSSKDDSGTVRVEVIDDGTGLPETFDPKTDGGLGLRLVRALGKQVCALVAFESTSHGLRFRLSLPPAPA
jgi:two-component sensor histidine kinase